MAKESAKKNEPEPAPSSEPDPGILASSPQDPAPAAPETVAVKVGDQEIQVDKATAELIEAQNAQFQAQIEQLKKPAPAPAPSPAPAPASEPQETDWDELAYNNPSGFADKIIETVTEKLTGQYNAQTAMRDFWGDFYDKNEDLKGHKTIVQAVMNQNMATLGDMPANEASSKLADMTRETIVGLVKQFGPKDPPSTQQSRTVVETGSGPAQPEPQPAEGDKKVLTMTDALRERRKARRKVGKSDTAA